MISMKNLYANWMNADNSNSTETDISNTIISYLNETIFPNQNGGVY